MDPRPLPLQDPPPDGPPWSLRMASLWHRLLHHGARNDLPCAGSNEVRLLTCGGDILEQTRELIRTARTSLHGEIYAWDDDETGRELLRLFLEAQARGVSVRLIVDHLGSWGVRGRLARAGLDLHFFHPISFKLPWRLWHRRNHRKLLIADGQRAVVGSANWGQVYDCAQNTACHRDLGVLVQGPILAHLEGDFGKTWRRVTRKAPTWPTATLPAPPLEGAHPGVDIQVVSSLARGGRHLRRHVTAWLRQVRHRVLIANAYFVPDARLIRQLARVARRGVAVDVLVPGSSDHPLVQAASRATYGPLLKSGVRVWERQEVMLHAKAALLEDDIVVLGSANLDTRSFRHNLELNLVLRHRALAAEVEAVLKQDLEASSAITPEAWAARSWFQRAWQALARSLAWWL